ncbi:MAG: PSD1 domain-containing protein [Acidobacteria bacterium]|nr:PSD1 domain-containing protein [Acidobacteriota bacterium]
MRWKTLCSISVLFGASLAWNQQKPDAAKPADKPTAEQLEFFEAKIRPVLAKNCYACHGSGTKNAMGGLFLDTKAGLMKGGANGPALIPGNPNESILIKAVRHEGRKMPPAGKLPDAAIADLEKWVAMGAPDPRVGAAAEWKESKVDIEKGRQYWAFQNPVKPASPKVRNAKWSTQPVDRLLLARLESKGLTPSPEADKATLIRRVTMDLTGLPPTAAEVTAFLNNKHPDAYTKLVDRLLASPQYGERWGRHWLDVARYAESVGRGRNYIMPYAWRYRDYVIDSFNADKPYDKFVMEQIAGDLLPASNDKQYNEQLTGTAFLSLGSHDLIEQNPSVFRMDVVDEQIHSVSKAFMGITVGCARCHDHKFDPIPTADYYAMAGIFRSTEMLSGLRRRPRDNASYFDINLLARLKLTPEEQANAWIKDPAKIAEWNELMKKLEDSRSGRSPALLQARRNLKKGQPIAPGQQVAVAAKLRQEANVVLAQMDKFPLPKDLAMAAREGESNDCEIHIKGDVKDLGRKVPRGFVQVVSRPNDSGFEIGPKDSGRLQLAKWLARKDNPLTARVMVNRVWLHTFGRGIVPTVDNFGKMGEQPTHQDILDYLAVRFMEQGWSVKKVVREVVLSKSYRMSTAYNDRNAKADPDNNLFWRQNRNRLEVEAIRDSIMMVAGKLNLQRPAESPTMGFVRGFDLGRGRGTYPEDYAVKMDSRSVYVPVLRNFLPAMYETFDFPEPSEPKGRREVTTVPTQALFLVNSNFAITQSKSAAEKLLADAQTTGRDRVLRVYREVLSRDATQAEIDRSLSFIDAMRSNTSEHNDEKTAWARLYQALFASAEFRYRS